MYIIIILHVSARKFPIRQLVVREQHNVKEKKKKKRKQDDKLAMNFPLNYKCVCECFCHFHCVSNIVTRVEFRQQKKEKPKNQPKKKIHQFIINNFYDHKFILLCVTYYVISVSSSSSMNLPILFSSAAEMK